MTTKILPFGVMVIDGDTHISKWVQQHGKLRIAEKYLAQFQKYVPVGGTVVDAGAMIGDHTATYADWVGPEGTVIAFEPNPEAFECLRHNTQGMHQVAMNRCGLSDELNWFSMAIDQNAGASHIRTEWQEKEVRVVPLDDFGLKRLDFLKLDIEGFETRALKGAFQTIQKLRPVMLIEVNEGALIRAGSSREELLKTIQDYGYSSRITEDGIDWSDPQYDVLCLP
jgi:FkbM family methyltransferase